MIAAPPVILDPFETESTLASEPRALSLHPRTFELSVDELVRMLSFDVVGAVPKPLGTTYEHVGHNGAGFLYSASYYQVGPQVLALATEIDEGTTRHRVLELLGVGGDVRVRLNAAQVRDLAGRELSKSALAAVQAGRALGQVRVWTSEPTKANELRKTIGRQLATAGLDVQVLGRNAREPAYAPPRSDRLALDALPGHDVKVAGDLLALLAFLPVPGQQLKPPRRIGVHTERVRREGSIVVYHYETHRAATGVVHVRRREVEAGTERPGLVRTFNVAGLAGAARVRIREVGGRAAAEFAGAAESVERIRQVLLQVFGARP
ncbi:MAG: hypothetical protein KF878_04800 [Planctomycetes bacterium]|nr:hypothetical protein [Planctomycetota bacterium]